MTTRGLSLLSVVLGIALIASVDAPPLNGQRMMISGSLEVVEQDLHGRPKAVELVSPELGGFRVAPDRHGRKLFAHVGGWVTVFGRVEIENGLRVVYVDGFRPLPLLSLPSAWSEVLHRAQGDAGGELGEAPLPLPGRGTCTQPDEIANAVPLARRSVPSGGEPSPRRVAQIEQPSV